MTRQPLMAKRSLAALAAALTWAAAQAAEPEALSLPRAIEEALARNPSQVSRGLEIGRAAEEVDIARARRLPSVDLRSSATYYGNPTLVVPIREIGVFPPLDRTIYDVGVALQVPIYAGGRLRQQIILAGIGREIAVENARRGRQALIFNVSSVYFKILHLAELERVYAARIASLEAQEERVRLLMKVGKAPRLDLLKTQVLLTRARDDRLNVRHSREEAYTLLYSLLGRDRPRDEARLIGYTAGAEPSWTLEELKEVAQLSHPALRIAADELAASEAEIRIARAATRPEVSLVGAYRERAGSDADFIDDWSIGVQLSLPLYDAGANRSRIDQAVLARVQAEQAVEQTRLEVDRQVEDAWNRRREALSRLDVTEGAVKEAREALEIERLRYEQGVGLITDLLEAESSLLTAQADRLQAEFDLIVARIEVLRASGRLTPERLLALLAVAPERDRERSGR